MNGIDHRATGRDGPRAFWRHRHFADLGLFAARFRTHRYPLHTHATYVVALITEGCERVRVGHRTVLAPAGSVLVVHPEEWHDGEAGDPNGWAYRTLYPSAALLSAVAAELGQAGPPEFAASLIEDHALADALARAHAASTSADPTEAEATMLAALRGLLRHAAGAGRPEPADLSGARRRVQLYADAIEAGLDGDIRLQQLAALAGVTRFQVIRDFRKAVGLTPASFIRDRRLRRAGTLIESGAGLAEAAAAAGFADQSHLSRSFRATRGITPGMFRLG